MKVTIGDGYEDGKAYIVTLTEVRQYADEKYQSDEIVPKFVFVWEGENGQLSRPFSLPVVDGEPAIRPNLAFSKALVAHGADWDDVKKGLEIVPLDKKDAKRYPEWQGFPGFAAHKVEGFEPVRVNVLVNGDSIIGSQVAVTVSLNKDGLAQVEAITPVPS